MKKILLLLVVASLSLPCLYAQNTASIIEMIKDLERQQCNAVVAQDREALTNLWAEDFMVNNPNNMVVTSRNEVLEKMAEGIIHYSEFTRKTESVMVLDKIVIVMGEETIKPIGKAPMAGKTVTRRYTNIWREIDGKWQVQARHANVIRVDE